VEKSGIDIGAERTEIRPSVDQCEEGEQLKGSFLYHKYTIYNAKITLNKRR
jgi:hypothetical protein